MLMKLGSEGDTEEGGGRQLLIPHQREQKGPSHHHQIMSIAKRVLVNSELSHSRMHHRGAEVVIEIKSVKTLHALAEKMGATKKIVKRLRPRDVDKAKCQPKRRGENVPGLLRHGTTQRINQKEIQVELRIRNFPKSFSALLRNE
jgi:hypothetical protein